MKGKTDFEAGVTVNSTVSHNMESIEDMNGIATFYGAGLDLGEILGISADYAYTISDTKDNRRVTAHTLNIGGNFTFVPGEINTGVTNTKVLKIMNIFDLMQNLYNKLE